MVLKGYGVLNEYYRLVRDWLVSTNLVIKDKNDDNLGGVHSFYDLKEKKYGFLYPEITGYYVSTMCFFSKYENTNNYLNLAKNSANWLIKIFNKYDAIVMGIGDELKEKIAFTFDTSICAKGMLDYFSLTGDIKYLRTAESLVNWILEGAIDDDGTVRPFMIVSEKRFSESSEVWYKSRGCLNIKIAMVLLALYRITKREELYNTAKKICDSCTRYQNHDGSIAMNEGSKTINLHTQCYALEGLVYAYHYTGESKYIQWCKKALDWSISKIEDDGSIMLWFNSKHRSKASYPVAQLIRLLILVDAIDNEHKYHNYVQKLYSFLMTMQAIDSSPHINGGFYEEITKSLIGWKRNDKINSWGSMFSAQAIFWLNMNRFSFTDSIPYLY
ncbi:hypothetical protein [Candidatus Nitrosotenuis uzonensis]|uniref:Uncharacterized protein n=1 Tax=Candidatus Nitrosotenuis uzonensis TaxID=1407055 RepID=A0A812EUX4_9ARCH|nr:hypothetical protein [Candidatus Nitrosotenuis uzonensis]CAE6488214.1 conserved hypothetical protein [Candidatus Nitrosotenuis uzonensis]